MGTEKEDIRHSENGKSPFILWALGIVCVVIGVLYTNVSTNNTSIAVIKTIVQYNKEALNEIKAKLNEK